MQQGNVVKTGRTTVIRNQRRGGAAHHIVANKWNATKEERLLGPMRERANAWSLTIVYTDVFSAKTSNTDAPKLHIAKVILCNWADAPQRYILDSHGAIDGSARRFVAPLVK